MYSLAGRLVLTSLFAVLISAALSGCRNGSVEGSTPLGDDAASILLFNGTGASAGDVEAVASILRTERIGFSTADSSQLNRMTELEMRKYRLLIVPGGNFELMGNSLTASTAAHVRNAVRNGLNYLGVCAGAFFAGNSPYNGLNLTSGSKFGFYSAEARGIRKAAVAIAVAEGPTLDQYWEDGPELTGWGSVVGKYPDGTPAVVEGAFGNGWVVLTGVHPEAPLSWRRGMELRTPPEIDHAYAGSLIRAAFNREWLPHY